MEETGNRVQGQDGPFAEARQVRDRSLLILLMFFASCLHGWMIAHTEVAARDSIGFIRYAWHLETLPWLEVFKDRKILHHPLYPITVLMMSYPVRLVVHASDSLVMQLSAQLASSLAGVLLVIPMFYLGKSLFDRRVGFWAALLFQCLPVTSRALSDGLTEGLFLLLTATALLMAFEGLRHGAVSRFVACGMCAGLAYLTRPEGALVAVAVGAVLALMQCLPAWRRSWRRATSCMVALSATALALAIPYMIVIEGVTKKTTGTWILKLHGSDQATEAQGEPADPEFEAQAAPSTGTIVTQGSGFSSSPGILWADFYPNWTESNHDGSLRWGIVALAKEIGKGFHYIVWIPTLMGLWWFRERFRVVPGAWLMATLCGMHLLLLLRVATVAGYVSERHTVLFVLCGVFWAVAGVEGLPSRLSFLGARMGFIPPRVDWWRRRRMVETLFVVGLVLYGLPSTLKPLHSGRMGHRAAGDWLAAHAESFDQVIDPFCWAHYYSGREFREGNAASIPAGRSATTYVVLDKARHHSRLPLLPIAEELATHGEIVYHWPEKSPEDEAKIVVYAVR